MDCLPPMCISGSSVWPTAAATTSNLFFLYLKHLQLNSLFNSSGHFILRTVSRLRNNICSCSVTRRQKKKKINFCEFNTLSLHFGYEMHCSGGLQINFDPPTENEAVGFLFGPQEVYICSRVFTKIKLVPNFMVG